MGPLFKEFIGKPDGKPTEADFVSYIVYLRDDPTIKTKDTPPPLLHCEEGGGWHDIL